MEKINVAELLRDCPTGMELDSPVWDNIAFEEVNGDNIVIFRKCCSSKVYLSQYGELHNIDGKCIIFPKGKTTWEGFHRPFEPGDIVITDNNEHAFIYSGENDNFWECYCGVYCGTRNICINSRVWTDKQHNIRLATEEEKEKLFKVIKDNGYKWNVETKTLDKLIEPSFKVGDKVRHKNNHGVVFTITSIEEDSYVCGAKAAFWFDDQDDYELVPKKFDLNTLKPLQPVLVRNTNGQVWTMDFFSHKIDTNKGLQPSIVCVGHCPNQCIPYKGNEFLRGTSDECKDFYKTWE